MNLTKDKVAFVKALAKYVSGNDAVNSIKLSMGDVGAVLWAEVRGATPVFGYVTVEETEQVLAEWLDVTMPVPERKKKVKK